MIADSDLKVSKLYGMLPAEAGETCEGRTAMDNQTVRNVYVIGPDKKIKLVISYPMSTGRNFDEVLRVIDSMQLTARHKVATPVNGVGRRHHPASGQRSRSAGEVSQGLERSEAIPADCAATRHRAGVSRDDAVGGSFRIRRSVRRVPGATGSLARTLYRDGRPHSDRVWLVGARLL